MRKLFYTILGTVLLFPLMIQDTFGISLQDLRYDVFRPVNLPVGHAGAASAETKINEIFAFAINLILYASGSVAVVLLIIGGVRYIMSFGNQEMMDGAKKTIKFALIGLVVVILAYAIVTNVVDLIYRSTV